MDPLPACADVPRPAKPPPLARRHAAAPAAPSRSARCGSSTVRTSTSPARRQGLAPTVPGLPRPGRHGTRRRAAERCGLRSPRPGKPATAQRQRFVMRLAAHVTRRVAQPASGSTGSRSAPGPAGTVDEIVVAIPWRHRDWGRGRARHRSAPVPRRQRRRAETDESVEAAVAGAQRSGSRGPRCPSPVISPRGAGRLDHRDQRQDHDHSPGRPHLR